jgi:hypothetical protein
VLQTQIRWWLCMQALSGCGWTMGRIQCQSWQGCRRYLWKFDQARIAGFFSRSVDTSIAIELICVCNSKLEDLCLIIKARIVYLRLVPNNSLRAWVGPDYGHARYLELGSSIATQFAPRTLLEHISSSRRTSFHHLPSMWIVNWCK